MYTRAHTFTYFVLWSGEIWQCSYSMWQYNVIVPFLRNEAKTERPFPFYKTPHPFKPNERTVLKWFVAEMNDHKTIHRWIKRWRTIRTLLLLLRALLQLLLCAIAAAPLRPVHLLPLVKGRNNESSPKLRVCGAPNRICRPRDHLFTIQSFFHRSARRQCFLCNRFPPFFQKAVKQTNETDRPFKRFDLSV